MQDSLTCKYLEIHLLVDQSSIIYSRTSLARTRRDCPNLFEPQRSRNFREKKSGSDQGQFHYAMITDAQ